MNYNYQFAAIEQESKMIRSITVGLSLAVSTPVAVYAQQTDDLFIPAVVETMWVILQDPAHTGEGSSESLAIAIPPAEFRAGLVQWQSVARSRGWKLVVTAYASEGDDEWPHWKIRYKGKRLKFARYKDPNGERVFTGVEFPVQ